MIKLKTRNSILIFCSMVFSAGLSSSFAENSKPITVLTKKIRSGYVKSVTFKIDSAIRTVDLPGSGARAETFACAVEQWQHRTPVVSFLLDDRGQIPSLAYYGLSTKRTCFYGVHGKLTFDVENQLVVEPLHSSASEQVIRRYEASECNLKEYDELKDKADIDDNPNYIKRKVTRIRGKQLARRSCEYSISEGKVLDPHDCFKK